MTEQDTRVGLASVAAGTLVALAIAATLGSAGAAVVSSGNDLSFDVLQKQAPVLGAVFAIILTIASYFGGRVAAIVSRTMLRRDGVLAGLVTGSVMALLLLAGAGWLALVWPASAASLFLACLTGAEVIAIGGGIMGGVSGARAEARAVGLKTVHVAKRGFRTSSAESYERDFFAEDSLPKAQS